MNIENLVRFRLMPNSKNPSSDWAKHNRASAFRKGAFKGNAGVPTGEVNNITVLDLDFYKNTGSNKFTEAYSDYINHCDTYTVQTANGGYHLYFQYDVDVKTTSNSKYHIDIRNEGAYVVSPHSSIDKKRYKVFKNTTIKPFPADIKQWLLDNIYMIPTKPTMEKKHTTNKQISQTVHKYNLSYSELEHIIENLPDKYWSNDNHGFLKYTSFCKYFDMKDLWDQVNKTKPNYNYDNNVICYWNVATCSEAIIDSILTEEYINYSKYRPCLSNDIKPDKQIHKKKLGYDFIKSKCNYVVKSDTGTGKTTAFKHYVKEHNLKFISIVSRISLADEQYNVFSEHGIECKNYRINDDFTNSDNIIITVDSIRKLYNIDFTEYVIFLDEYNSLLEYLATANTLSKHRSIIYKKFIKIIKQCKQVVATDADINDTSLRWIRTYKTNIKYIQNTYKHNKNVLAYELNNFAHLIEKIKSEEKFLLCTDSKTNAELIYKQLNDPSVCLIVGGDDTYYKLDEYDKVIFSPKIMYGIDSSMKRNVYCYYKEHTIQPTGYLQQIARCRNINTLYYLFDKKKFTFSDKSYDDIVNDLYKQNVLGCRYFEDEVKTDVYVVYQDLLNKYMYNNHCYSSNKFAHFRTLLMERGFKIEFNNKFLRVSDKNMKELKKELKADKLDNFDVTQYPKIHKLLQVPDEKIDEYKEFYIDSFLLTKHFNLMSMIHKDNIELKHSLTSNNDYNVNKITLDKTKILYLQKLKSYMNDNTDFNTMSINKEISTEDRKILFEEYNIIFRNRSIKKTFDTDYQICEYVSKIYKVLFGSDIITTTDTRTVVDGKRTKTKHYAINEAELDKHNTLYSFRHTAPVSKRLF